MGKQIYLDNAATTPLHSDVLQAMLPYYTEFFGNPGAVYSAGVKAASAVNAARKVIAASINAEPSEVYFTSGGTESDNWAIRGTAQALREKGRHIITAKTEHHAVLNSCLALQREGFEITVISPEKDGRISVDKIREAVREDTILISVMMANNELGSLNPIKEIGAFAKSRGIIFHTDAVQAFGHLPIDVKEMNIDLLSASAHKIHGPKGTGFLYMNSKCVTENLIFGGSQERRRRAGTENVAGIVGFSTATDICMKNMEADAKKVRSLREQFEHRVLEEIAETELNSCAQERLPGISNIRFIGVPAESMLILLDIKGICASAGAACTSALGEVSHVLRSVGLTKEAAGESLRFSFSSLNTEDEINAAVEALKETAERIRNLNG